MTVFLAGVLVSAAPPAEHWQTVAEESFENSPTWAKWNTVPAGWALQRGGKGKAEIMDDNCPGERGGKCLKLEQTGHGPEDKSTTFLAVRLPWKDPEAVKGIRVSFHFKLDDKAGGWDFLCGRWTDSKFFGGPRISLRDHLARIPEHRNHLSAIARGVRRTPCCLVPTDAWNEAVVVLRPPFKTYTLYLRTQGGELRAFPELVATKNEEGLPPSFFMLGAWHYDILGTLWIDDFKVEVQSANRESVPNTCNPPRARETVAAFAETAPVIDGELDDNVWRAATAAEDFHGWKESKSTRQTRGLLSYDHDNLYVAFDNREPAPDSIRAETHAPLGRDQASWEDDLVEFFLQLGPGAEDYVQFAVSAGDAGWEFSNNHRAGFNPDWKWALGRSPEGWTVEMAVPWRQLAGETKTFHWPPAASERWGVNFHRYVTAAGETTVWNPMTAKGFHDPRNMGLAAFLPPASRSYVNAIESLPAAGESRLALGIVNPSATQVRVSLQMQEEGSSAGKPVGKTDASLPAEAEGQLVLPVNLPEGSKWNAEAGTDASAIFSVQGQAEPVREQQLRSLFQRQLASLASARDVLEGVPAARQAGLSEKIASYQTKAEEALALLGKQGLSFEEAIRLKEAATTFENDAGLQGIPELARYLAGDSEAWERKYILTQASSMAVIRPETVCPDNAAKGVDVELAANEGRSFLIQVIAPWEPLTKVKVEAELPNMQVQVRQLGYLHTPKLVRFSGKGAGPDQLWFPDPLVVNAPFDLKQGRSRVLWVTVGVPPGTQPGDYTGAIRIAPEGRPAAAIPLKVKVWNFSLPEVSTLRVWSWFWPQYGPLNLLDLKNYEAFFKEYSRYKQGLDPGWGITKKIKAAKHADGSFSFDFSDLDPYYEIAFRYGTRSFNMALNCHDALRGWLSGQVRPPLVTLSDGSAEELDLYPDGDPRSTCQPPRTSKRWAEAPFEEPMRPIYEQMLKTITAHWKEKDWYRYAHFEALDEPEINDFYVDVYRRRKEIVPDLPLMSFGVGKSVRNIGINSVWAPNMRDLPVCLKFMRERKSKGETAFFYICGYPGQVWNQNRNSPDVHAWEPPIDRRVLGWMSWKWGIEGWYEFVSNIGWRSHPLKPNKCGNWNPWPYDTAGYDFTFIHLQETAPGKWVWVPSARLDNWRDGIEDYEYLHLVDTMRERLSRYGGPIDESERKRLLLETESMLDLESLIPGNDIFGWDHNPKAYDERRHAMGEWLHTVAGALHRAEPQ